MFEDLIVLAIAVLLTIIGLFMVLAVLSVIFVGIERAFEVLEEIIDSIT